MRHGINDEIGFTHKEKLQVLIVFDDGLAPIYQNAYTYMEDLGLKGTVYTITNLVNVGGHLNLTQLEEMQDTGWTIANHSDDHTNLYETSLENQIARIGNAKTWLNDNGFGEGQYHLAYPYGGRDNTTFTAMDNLNMKTGRHSGEGSTSPSPPINWKALSSIMPVSTTTVSDCLSYADNCIINDRIGIYSFHNIVTTTPETWQWSKTDFETVIDALLVRGAEFLSIVDLYNKYGS